ncbi:MAG: NUDIX domain-containing protein [Oscillospiraceae bacterium]|nr:NUDIX domain-containing protein [Oscillospiraceae bacterium]
MSHVSFYSSPPSGIPLPFVVICARLGSQWILARHKQRATYEIPGGHIEPGEEPAAAARRELYEETGAADFTLHPVCVYTVTAEKSTDGGYLFFADVKALAALPAFEMAEVCLFDRLPEQLTYPHIQPYLFDKVQQWLQAHL